MIFFNIIKFIYFIYKQLNCLYFSNSLRIHINIENSIENKITIKNALNKQTFWLAVFYKKNIQIL